MVSVVIVELLVVQVRLQVLSAYPRDNHRLEEVFAPRLLPNTTPSQALLGELSVGRANIHQRASQVLLAALGQSQYVYDTRRGMP